MILFVNNNNGILFLKTFIDDLYREIYKQISEIVIKFRQISKIK